MKSTSFSLIVTLVFFVQHNCIEFKYHSNKDLANYLQEFATRFPNISQVYSIGKSVKGQDLWVMKLTSTKDYLAPNVKLIGNIHGNEAIGREILLQLIDHIGISHNVSETIKFLLDNTVLHIMPTLNPDGFAMSNIGRCEGMKGRDNANGQDLNRNYPDYFMNIKTVEQPETTAIRKWMNATTFLLSAGLHSGALVANYPFDSPKEQLSHEGSQSSLAPDNDVLRHLSLVYAREHLTMHKGNFCENYFPNGITNGAKWYEFQGGMPDYNYAFMGTMEITLELSCCKFPMTKFIEKHWIENKAALVAFSLQATRGLRGVFTDYNLFAKHQDISLKIAKRNISFYPDRYGRFWRILLPGRYTLQVFVDTKILKSIQFSVENDNKATTLNISLFKLSASTDSSSQLNENKMTTAISATTSKLSSTFDDDSKRESNHSKQEMFKPHNFIASNAMQITLHFSLTGLCAILLLGMSKSNNDR